MSAYDGTIKIDTSINSKNFNTGIKGMIGSIKSLALTMGLALGVGGIIAFGRASVDAAAEMSNAFVGLQSIVEGQGKSFSQAKKFLQEYVADGLVPLTNAAAAYKNLAARGYSTDQIEQTLTALKNSAAFGRQGSLTMGQAIQGATEGLKNENSILVDNAGVTKNVSMMWRDYAESIGTTVGALTKEQKIQAEINGIMEETKFQTGDAAKMAQTYSGQISAIGVSFMNLKAAIGNALIPIIMQLLPYVKAAIDALTVFFNKVGQVVNVLFGTNVSVADAATETTTELADSTEEVADSQDHLAESTENATKAAKGALAAFDQLNVLQQESTDTTTDTGTGTTETPQLLPAVDETPIAEGLTDLQKRILEFKEKMLEYLQPVIELWKTLGEVWDAVMKVLRPLWEWFWQNILVPLGKFAGAIFLEFLKFMTARLKDFSVWIGENQTLFLFILGFFALLALAVLLVLSPAAQFIAILLLIGSVLAATAVIGFIIGYSLRQAWDWIVEKWQDAAEWFNSTVTEPISEYFSSLWIDIQEFASNARDEISERWSDLKEWFRVNVVDPLGVMFTSMWGFAQILASDAWLAIQFVWGLVAEWFTVNVITPLAERFSSIWSNIKLSAEDAKNKISETWSGVGAWFNETVVAPLEAVFTNSWNRISDTALAVWQEIKTVFGVVEGWMTNSVGDPIRETFDSALDWIQDKFENVFDGIYEFVKGILNGVIEMINGLLSGITSGFNGLIDGANLMGSVIPGWVSIPNVSAIEIPYLAKGAVIPPNSQFLAMLGDQKSGRNIEAPEGLIRQIISEEIGKITADIRVTFDGTLAAVVREMKPHIDAENVRIGKSLLKGSTS